MKHANRICQTRRMDHTKGAGVIPQPDLLNALPTIGMGLKSSGCLPRCKAVKLTTGILPCIAWKISKILE